MDIYRKEIFYTLLFFVLYLLVTHTAVWAVLFGTNNDLRVLGFPLHYFAAIVLGWFGVMAVSICWNIATDRLDEEIGNSEGAAKAPGKGGK